MYSNAIKAAKDEKINFLSPKEIKTFRNTVKTHRIAEYILQKYGEEK